LDVLGTFACERQLGMPADQVGSLSGEPVPIARHFEELISLAAFDARRQLTALDGMLPVL
jgi:hypothetical protein